MRILVLSFYYRPDLSAGSFRVTAFVEQLRKTLGETDRVDVLTTMPNRYQTFEAQAPAEETDGPLHIHRIALPPHASGMGDQARAFTTYVRAVLRLTRGERYDLVFASSSRLFTASLGAFVARRVGASAYLDIRDIFTETISDVLGRSPVRIIMPALHLLERLTIRSAARVNLVSPGFASHFRRIDPSKDYRMFTNGIDEEFLAYDFLRPQDRKPKTVVYAGNIGDSQGLDLIVPALAMHVGEEYRFLIVGDGGARRKLEAALAARNVSNVEIRPPVPRNELMGLYAAADVLFLHLNDLPAFQRVLPSKIFEYAATGKPVLAGVAGYAAEFLSRHVKNAAVFYPCDAEAAVAKLESLDAGETPRHDFIAQFRRTTIIERLASDVLALQKQAVCASS